MFEVDKFNTARKQIEKCFNGLPHTCTTLIKSLITSANPLTGEVNNITYNDLAELLKVDNAPGRKNSGTPSKQAIRNCIKSIERACGEYFKVISEGQNLQFLFPEIPKIFNKLFQNTEVNIDVNPENTQENTGVNAVSSRGVNTELNTEANTPSSSVKNNNIFNITNTNKQTNAAYFEKLSVKKPIDAHFYPNQKTIELAHALGLTKVTDATEIQAFINHNKKQNTQWADFNPVFMTWLEREVQYTQKQKQHQKVQGQLRSHHNERGINQNRFIPEALERVSQQHGLSIESIWDEPAQLGETHSFIEGTCVTAVDETHSPLWNALY